jgi:hypothetical protein
MLANNKEYKFSAKFEAIAKIAKTDEIERKEAFASLKNLGGVFAGSDLAQTIDKNPDLLFISSNLIGLDEINFNGDAVTTEDILTVDELFRGKFFDIEHVRADGAVGVISNVGYSIAESNEMIPKSQVSSETRKVQMVVGGYLWRLINRELCDLVENSSDNEDEYISTSFELLFNDYWIAVSPTRNLKDGRIIKPSDAEWSKYDSLLLANGGSGKENGNFVGRILKDEILPVGAGIVRKPASGIKGILTVTESPTVADDCEPKETEDDEEKMEDEDTEDTEEIEDEEVDAVISAKIRETIKNTINIENLSVNQNITSKNIQNNMDIKTFQELEAKWSEIAKLEATASIPSIRKVFEAEILVQSEKFAADLKAKEDFIKNVEASKLETEVKVKELDSTVSALQKQLDEVRSAQASAEKESAFNARMGTLDETFELDDEDRSILTEEVREIADDESFAKWFDKKKKLMKEKTKAFMKEKKENCASVVVQTEVVKTEEKSVSASVDTKAAVASIVETANQSFPNSVETQRDIKAMFAAAFAEGVTVNGVKVKDLKKTK